VAGVRHIGNLLVLLGLIGTVVGFIMALGGIDPGEVGDPSSIGPMVARLIKGMGVALNTTLLGAVLNIWLGFNARLLEAGCVRLFRRLVAQAEAGRHA
jgi:biopolymer transport protein ExbB/TolQ